MDIYELRKSNLRQLIGNTEEHGAVAAFAKKHNLDPTYVRQILNNHRKMGEKAARKFEETLDLKRGTLDHQSVSETAAPYNVRDLSQRALAVAAAFESSSPELQEAALRMLGVLRDIDKGMRD